jgi:hypothetical protein
MRAKADAKANAEAEAAAAAERAARKLEWPECYCCLDGGDDGMLDLAGCRHRAHEACLRQQLAGGAGGKRLTFAHLKCGLCRAPLQHPAIDGAVAAHRAVEARVAAVSVAACLADGHIAGLAALLEDPATAAAARELCCDTVAVFNCTECAVPFCGGRVDCAADDALDAAALRCSPCAFAALRDSHKCRGHGYKYAIYKCDSCCAVATFDCRTNHYCGRCHGEFNQAKDYQCPGPGKCPLGLPHPPNKPGVHGQIDAGFVLGCVQCFTDTAAAAAAQEGASGAGAVEVFRNEWAVHVAEVSDQWGDRF